MGGTVLRRTDAVEVVEEAESTHFLMELVGPGLKKGRVPFLARVLELSLSLKPKPGASGNGH